MLTVCIWLWLRAGIPIGIFQSMFAVVAMEMFGLSATQNGYLMSYIGMLSMLVQGVGMGLLNRRFSELQLIQGGVFVLIWAYLALVSACHSFVVDFCATVFSA